MANRDRMAVIIPRIIKPPPTADWDCIGSRTHRTEERPPIFAALIAPAFATLSLTGMVDDPIQLLLGVDHQAFKHGQQVKQFRSGFRRLTASTIVAF